MLSPILIKLLPIREAESAIMIDGDKDVGVFGPTGTSDTRLLDADIFLGALRLALIRHYLACRGAIKL